MDNHFNNSQESYVPNEKQNVCFLIYFLRSNGIFIGFYLNILDGIAYNIDWIWSRFYYYMEKCLIIASFPYISFLWRYKTFFFDENSISQKVFYKSFYIKCFKILLYSRALIFLIQMVIISSKINYICVLQFL